MHLRITRRPASAAPLLALALIGLLLAGCGSSSSSTTKTTAASASATAPGNTGGSGGTGATGGTGSTGARGAGRGKAIRECLQKAGINLPAQPQGTRPRGGGAGGFFGGSGGGPALPKGVTREQFQAALKKCGLGRRFGAGGRFGAGRGGFNTPAFRKTLASFASCMDEHGVKLPAANTSGKGPVFDTSGINTNTAAFQKAEVACRSKVHLFFPGAGAPAPPGGG